MKYWKKNSIKQREVKKKVVREILKKLIWVVTEIDKKKMRVNTYRLIRLYIKGDIRMEGLD